MAEIGQTKGHCKVRGNSDYYRTLSLKGLKARGLKPKKKKVAQAA